ncbi:MAG: hypothetical protein HYV60_18045 [Planctomycetia bacterium]|nr:hypothetical protein [Planctomycetia bacterium]
MIFLLPWGDDSLLGTTDTPFTQPADAVRTERDDVDYLLAQLRELAPSCAIEADDIITSFAGVRALIRSERRKPSGRSREELIVLSGENLLTVAGGKYTTFRAIADKVVRRVNRMLGQRATKCLTATTPLENCRPAKTGVQLSQSPLVFESDIAFACTNEMVATLEDVMRRRTRLALSGRGGADVATQVSHLVARQLQWSETVRREQLNAYLQYWQRSRPWQVARP